MSRSVNDFQREIRIGYSFDDVLLVPRRTRATSRSTVDVRTKLTPGIDLAVPLVSANTPWCTEADMAAAMAAVGGIGFIHRMTSAAMQAEEVRKTKSALVDKDALPEATVDSRGRFRVGAAVGVKADFLHRAEALVEAGTDVLILDIAHGHADYVLEAIRKLRTSFPEVDLVAGNVATADGVSDLISAGAQAIKVGIGPGSVCTTRIVTGAGVPQLTAVLECSYEAQRHGIPVIADGGIRSSGDVAKALGAGASTVMLGKLLAGTDESAAILVEREGRRHKITNGFVTLGVGLTLKRLEGGAITEDEFREYVPEGVEATFEYAGSLRDVIRKIVGGLRSGLSYCGSMSIPELWQKAQFIQVTSAGNLEGHPHVQEGVRSVHPDYASLFVSCVEGAGASEKSMEHRS
jgi:IMP dehydrogenase/GMP reductase